MPMPQGTVDLFRLKYPDGEIVYGTLAEALAVAAAGAIARGTIWLTITGAPLLLAWGAGVALAALSTSRPPNRC